MKEKVLTLLFWLILSLLLTLYVSFIVLMSQYSYIEINETVLLFNEHTKMIL